MRQGGKDVIFANDNFSSHKPIVLMTLTLVGIERARTKRVYDSTETLRYKSEGRGFDSRCCHWNFSLTYSFRSGVDSASTGNEYQEYFLGVKAAGV